MSAQILAEAGLVVNELVMTPVAFGIVTFTILTAAFLVTFAFRSIGTRN